jgi:hypothetical protein
MSRKTRERKTNQISSLFDCYRPTVLFVAGLRHLECQATDEDEVFCLGFDEFGTHVSRCLLW